MPWSLLIPAAERLLRHGRRRRTLWLLAATLLLTVAVSAARLLPHPPGDTADTLTWVALTLASSTALLLSLTRPGTGLALGLSALAAHELTGQPLDWPVPVVYLGVYTVMRSERPRLPWLAATVAVVVLGFVTDLGRRPAGEAAGDAVSIGLGFAVAALVGELARRRHQRLAVLEERARDQDLLRELEAGAAVAAERARMARELHDVLAHAVSAMVVQAGAGRRAVRRRPDDAEASFASIEATGREALDELRRLIGGVRADAGTAPAPSIGYLDPLLREAPVPVRVTVTGQPVRLEPGVDLTAYRVIQEALTNVRKHAPQASEVLLALTWSPGALEVVVSDDGPATPPGGGSGFGLLGMGERVATCGGTLRAGPGGSGVGWRVRAHLPVPTGPPSAPSRTAEQVTS